MRVIRQHLIGDGIDIFAGVIFGEIKLDKIRILQRRSVDGVSAVFFNPGENVREVEDGPRRGADGMRERLERQGTEFEWETSKRGVDAASPCLSNSSAGAGRVCVF